MSEDVKIEVGAQEGCEDEEYGEWAYVRKVLKKRPKPDDGGRISRDDEGPLNVAITNHANRVVMVFEDPTGWIAMGRNSALNLCDLIMKAANACTPEETQH